MRLGCLRVTGVTVESIYLSQVFDNSQWNSLRGVVTGSLCPPLLSRGAPNLYKNGITIRCRGSLSFDLVFRNGETRKRISIRSLCPQRTIHPVHVPSARQRMPIHALFLSAPAHTDLYPLSSAHEWIPIRILCPQCAGAYRSVSYVLSMQAHTDPYSLSLGIHSRMHQPKPR